MAVTGRHEQGDYRLRRAGLFWVVERRWFGGWSRIGGPMRWLNAHDVFHELDDWQVVASLDVSQIMRGEMPRQPHGAE